MQTASTKPKLLFSVAVAGLKNSDEENSIAANRITSVARSLSQLFNFDNEEAEADDGRCECAILLRVSMLEMTLLWKIFLLRTILTL